MCYTYNNYPQGLDSFLDSEVSKMEREHSSRSYLNRPSWESLYKNWESNSEYNISSIKKWNKYKGNSWIRKAQIQWGKYSGFQLIIDNHAMNNLVPRRVQGHGYTVHITTPGVVSSVLSFYVKPEHDGEHNFYMHGIHSITVSKKTYPYC